MDDLIAFVTARLDEDERELAKDPPAGLGYANLAARMHLEIEAKRMLLGQFRLRGNSVRATVRPVTGGVWDDLLRILALPWADHPDYRPEWKP